MWMALSNTLAYYDTSTITTVKCYIVKDPVANLIKLHSMKFTLLSVYCLMFYSGYGARKVNYDRKKFCSTGPRLNDQKIG
jgi:hypothetical protein